MKIESPKSLQAKAMTSAYLQALNQTLGPGATLVLGVLHQDFSTIVCQGNRYTLHGLLLTMVRDAERQIDASLKPETPHIEE